jgi:hypothetical protein
MAVKELVKQVSSLVKVLGDKPTYAPAARGSSGSFKDDIDGELLNKLSHPQLKYLYHKFLSWDPKPELTTYHISFMKNYLSLLVYYQERHMCWVSEKLNKSLFQWIHNQQTYLRLYKQGTEEGGKFHIINRYIIFLTKLGMSVKVSSG